MVQNNIFHDMLRAIAEVYETEADPQGSHTAKTLLVTPSPVAFDPVLPCLFDAGIRAVLADGVDGSPERHHNVPCWCC